MRNQIWFTLLISLCAQFTQAAPYHEKALYKASMREVGHQLLLADNDSISRVLPIQQVNDSTYLISFENNFAFLPGDLSFIVFKALEGKSLTNSYIVEAISCETQEVLYSYSFNDTIHDEVACQGRVMPTDCYQIQFIALSNVRTQSSDLASFNSIHNENEPNAEGKSWYQELLLGIVILFAFGWIISLYKSKKGTEELQDSPESQNELKLGNSTFHPIQMRLKVKEKEFELTSKESNLLEIFIEHINQQLTRDELLHKVWGDEGDYIGRTLDVYVSKLRKKLEADESIRLINIRGIGYKLIQE